MAQIGSISVTLTTIPSCLRLCADPLPTSPYPITRAFLPARNISVPLFIPSFKLCLVPYLLSAFDLVTESFTLIAGTFSSPFSIISLSLKTPVVVSSVMPWIFSRISGYLLCAMEVRSPPSSRIIFASQGFPSDKIVCSMHQLNSSSV